MVCETLVLGNLAMTTATAIDPYATLGVPRTASAEEIERAFRERAMAEHPDRGGDTARMAELNAARETLAATAAAFTDNKLDAIKRLVAGKPAQEIMRIRDEIRGHIKSFEQRAPNGIPGGPLNSPLLARRRRELEYLNWLLA
jgi:hypothetical protein